MRRGVLVLLFLFGAIAVSAQHYLGVRGGFGGGSVRVYPNAETGVVWGLYSGGVAWKYYSPVQYVGAVGAEMLFLQRGFKWDEGYGRDSLNYRRHINSIMVPLLWQPHAYLFNRRMRVFVDLGLTFSYNINSTYEKVWYKQEREEGGRYDMMVVRDNRWMYGLVGGAGIGLLFGRWEAMIEARYFFGYSDILKNRTKYEYNPLRSPIDNIDFSVGVFYRLGGDGESVPRSERARMRRAMRDAERDVRRGTQQVLETPDPIP